jgi:soluble lytic murein transglycosylase-like protein
MNLMGGLLGALSGGAKAAADIGEKYRAQELADEAARRNDEIFRQRTIEVANLSNQMDIQKEDRAIAMAANPQIIAQQMKAKLLGQRMTDEYADNRTIEMSKNPLLIEATKEKDLNEKYGDIQLQGIKQRGDIELQTLKNAGDVEVQNLRNSVKGAGGGESYKDLEAQLEYATGDEYRRIKSQMDELQAYTGATPSKNMTSKYSGLISKHAKANNVNANLATAMLFAESNDNPGAVSPAGAIGLLQVMPKTGGDYGFTPDELKDPDNSVSAGTQHIKMLNKHYANVPDQDTKTKLVIAAYNFGQGNVDAAIAKTVNQGREATYDNVSKGFPSETKKYVVTVLDNYSKIADPKQAQQPDNGQSIGRKHLSKASETLVNYENSAERMNVFKALVAEGHDPDTAIAWAADESLKQLPDGSFNIGGREDEDGNVSGGYRVAIPVQSSKLSEMEKRLKARNQS